MVQFRRVISVAVAAIFLAACAGSGSGGSSNKPFVLGVTLSYSGAFGTNGPAQTPAFKAAVAHINSTGGILGRQMKVVFRDDQSDVNKTVLAVQELMDSEHADAVWPESVSAFITAALPFVTQHKLISFDVGSVNDPQKFPYNFQMGVVKPQDVSANIAAFEALPPLVSGMKPLKNIAIASTNDANGQLYANSAETQLKAKGYTQTAKILFSAGLPDLTVQVKQLQASKPDAVMVHVFGADVGTFMKAVRDVGWKDVVIVGDPGTTPFIDLKKVVPEEVQGQLYFPQYKNASREGDTADSPFIQALLKEGPIVSLTSAGLVYDALAYMRWGFNKAGTTDAEKVKSVLEGVGSKSAGDLPNDLVFFTGNPGYSATNHSCSGADITDLYALSKVSPLVNGTFQRIGPLKTPKPS